MILLAEPADAAALTVVAIAAKHHWGYPDNWMADWTEVLHISPGLVPLFSIKKAVESGQIVGFSGIRANELPVVWLEHLWVLPEFMGQGWGTALFRDAEREAVRLGAGKLRIASDPHAEGFYHRMGASKVGSLTAPMEGAVQRTMPLMEKRLFC